MMDLKRLSRLPYITKRIYILENICQLKNVDLEYLFGLFNLYKSKNSGKWFWQKVAFTGTLKEDYNYFNMVVDKIVNDLKETDEKKTKEQMKSASEKFDKFLVDLEIDCNVDRKNDFNKVKGFLDKNLKILIIDNLKRIK
jgi:hypothetical protein